MKRDSATLFATSTGITEQDIEEARSWIGVPLRLAPPYNADVTADSIRHFAHSFGDDNPRWCGGPAHPAGAIVAPPTYLYSVFAPGIGPGFGGLQGFHAGGRWEFVRPVVPGETITPTAELVDVRDVQGSRSGRTIIQSGLTEYRTDGGELVATNISRTFRKPRPGHDDAMKVEPHAPYELSEAELESLEDRILAYRRRGEQPRYWEDTTVGEPLEERIKGPLILNDITVFSVNVGIVNSGEIALRRRRQVAADPDRAPNHRPIQWLTDRTPAGQGHLEPHVARAVGVPTAYDNGWLRVCWMGQFVTDWMGDDAWLKSLEVKLRLPNLLGDVLFVNGSVSGLQVTGAGEHLAHLELVARRQDGATSCTIEATVQLPSRTGGAPTPEVRT